jgi:hypothetical protein
MNEVIKFYRLFNLLNLDVAAGAVVGSLFFAKIYPVVVSYPSVISLGLTVWMIYTADRLLDVQNIKGEAASERHRFHQRNQKKLRYGLVGVVIVDIALICFMPGEVIKHGIFLSGVVTVYILLRRKLHISKELLVASLYTAGVLLPAWPEGQMSLIQYLPILLFFLIALTNLIIFSWYEKENDLKDKQNSVATLVDEGAIRFVLIGLFVTNFSISLYLFSQQVYHFMSLVFITMTIVLFLIFRYSKFFAPNDYYRLVGDAVFLIPIFYLLA